MRRNIRARRERFNLRVGTADLALLSVVAGRLQRSRSDTIRLLVRAAAAELDAGTTGVINDGLLKRINSLDMDLYALLPRLITSSGKPRNLRLAAIWKRAVDEGVDALEADEFDALQDWIVNSMDG